MPQSYVYILASRSGGAIYVGVTKNLVRRVYEHKNGLVSGHTKRFCIDKLVYFEPTIRFIKRFSARRT